MKILFRFAAVRFLFFLLGIFSAKADPESGVVVAWGNNSSGQCNIPAGLTNAIAIACGGNHSLAVNSNGTVVAWGDNSFGQTNVPTNLTNVIAVAAGYQHSLALKNNGMVVAWGDNLSGSMIFGRKCSAIRSRNWLPSASRLGKRWFAPTT